MPKNKDLKSILIIGSGPIIIGQACEFDYSGTQALRSLREDGIETILINSNPATIMTDKVTADHIYLLPLTANSIEQILKERHIDAVLPTMGGQTALNLCKEADELGIWTKYNVRIIGVDIDAIEKTENREQFRQLMVDLEIGIAQSQVANSYLEGKEIAQTIGYPLVIRPSYTLGGSGGSFVHSKDEFEAALKRGLEASPTHEVLIEKAVLGWKEFELELLRVGVEDRDAQHVGRQQIARELHAPEFEPERGGQRRTEGDHRGEAGERLCRRHGDARMRDADPGGVSWPQGAASPARSARRTARTR